MFSGEEQVRRDRQPEKGRDSAEATDDPLVGVPPEGSTESDRATGEVLTRQVADQPEVDVLFALFAERYLFILELEPVSESVRWPLLEPDSCTYRLLGRDNPRPRRGERFGVDIDAPKHPGVIETFAGAVPRSEVNRLTQRDLQRA